MKTCVESNNKSELAYSLIENMITFQYLKPGSMVSEKQLSESLNLGRTPIREALQKLAHECMVEILPRKGILIPPISVEVQLKLLEVRKGVKEVCVRLAAARASSLQRQQLKNLAERLAECGQHQDDARFILLLKESHQLLVKAANNDFIQIAMAPLQGLSRRFWFAHKNGESDFLEAAYCHAAILRAVSQSDVQAAVMASHKLDDYLMDMAYRSTGSH